MRKIAINLGNERAIAVLLDNEAPKTCNAIWNCLTWEADVHHARICKNELIFMMPAIVDMENPAFPVPGDIGYWCSRQCVNIWYDEMQPLAKTNLFAKIVENLEGLKKEAKRVFQRPGSKIKVTKVEG